MPHEIYLYLNITKRHIAKSTHAHPCKYRSLAAPMMYKMQKEYLCEVQLPINPDWMSPCCARCCPNCPLSSQMGPLTLNPEALLHVGG